MAVNLLRGKIDEMSKSRPSGYGMTDAGKTWCLKALHPADEGVPLCGMPDSTNFPTVTNSYNMLFRLNKSSAVTTPNWGFDLSIVPDFIQPIVFQQKDASGTPIGNWGEFLNPQLQVVGTSTYDNNRAAFMEIYEQWRMTYMSVTITQDAPALADEGLITACQAPTRWVETNPCLWQCTSGDSKDPVLNSKLKMNGCPSSAPPPLYLYNATTYPHVHSYFDQDMPSNFVQSGVTMPGGFVGKAKDGCYMPIKLTESAFEWKTAADVWLLGPHADEADDHPDAYPITIPSTDTYSLEWPYGYVDYQSTTPENGPNIFTAFLNQTAAPLGSWICGGSPILPWANQVVGHINLMNLDANAGIEIRVRMGMEARVGPGTLLTPQMKLSASVDEQAMYSYFAISRQLADAYPGSYNDLGKLWEVIKSIGRGLKPVLSAIPMTAPFVQPIEMLGDVVDSWVGSPKGQGPGKRQQQRQPVKTMEQAIASSVANQLNGRTQVVSKRPQPQKLTKAQKRARREALSQGLAPGGYARTEKLLWDDKSQTFSVRP
jgi:hypothetical protein